MHAIIYSGKKLPSCDNEFFQDVKSMRHAGQPSLITQIVDSKLYGISTREIEPGSFRHVIDFSNPTNEKRNRIVDAMDLIVVLKENDYSCRKILKCDGITASGNISCPEIHYFMFPWGQQWKDAFTTGMDTKNFTLFASMKEVIGLPGGAPTKTRK